MPSPQEVAMMRADLLARSERKAREDRRGNVLASISMFAILAAWFMTYHGWAWLW